MTLELLIICVTVIILAVIIAAVQSSKIKLEHDRRCEADKREHERILKRMEKPDVVS